MKRMLQVVGGVAGSWGFLIFVYFVYMIGVMWFCGIVLFGNRNAMIYILMENITVYPFKQDDAQRGCSVLKMSAKSIEKNPDLCAKEWVNALRALPAGFYTVVVHCADGDAIEDILVGKRGGLSVRPYDGKTINDPQRQPCLRVEVMR
jgi:hypothetical protein